MNNKHYSILLLILVLFFFSCENEKKMDSPSVLNKTTAQPSYKKYRILYVNSYHMEYPWVQGIIRGMFSVLNLTYTDSGQIDNSQSPVEFRMYHMDTQRNTSLEHIDFAVNEIRNIIENWHPDVVIASDDNASKYLIEPYYKNSTIPFVFCGVNLDASGYGFPTPNITGMIEVHLVLEMFEELRPFARGSRVAYLRSNDLTTRKIKIFNEEILGRPVETPIVNSFAQWKEEFIRLQDDSDILIPSYPTFNDFDGDMDKLKQFMLENTRIPTGSWEDWMKETVLLTINHSPEEQGEWAANTALEILNGKSPSQIPLAFNKRGIFYINMKLAKQLNIEFPLDLIEKSHMVNTFKDKQKIFYVNSYHQGYIWSDEIEKGLIKALDRSGINYELKIFRMNTKFIMNEEDEIQRIAGDVKAEIDDWNPDILLGSDDNFVKYVVLPYYKDTSIPVVFCGVNWSAAPYRLPASNITGMVEIDPIHNAVETLQILSKGKQLGVLFQDEYVNHTIKENLEQIGKIKIDKVSFVKTADEWKESYLSMQNEVDMLIIYNPIGLKGWDNQDVLDFIYKNTKIPVACSIERHIQYALIGYTKIAEEQGWWLGKTASKILDGTEVTAIPLAHNEEFKLTVNITMANELGIKIPPEIMENAVLWNKDNE